MLNCIILGQSFDKVSGDVWLLCRVNIVQGSQSIWFWPMAFLLICRLYSATYLLQIVWFFRLWPGQPLSAQCHNPLIHNRIYLVAWTGEVHVNNLAFGLRVKTGVVNFSMSAKQPCCYDSHLVCQVHQPWVLIVTLVEDPRCYVTGGRSVWSVSLLGM